MYVLLRYFHGLTKKRSFVEGWYFKHIQDGTVITVMPGIHIDHIGRRFAFIEVITNDKCYYIHYPFSAFEANGKKLDVQIGENHFSTKGIKLYINTPELILKGIIHYDHLAPIPYEISGPFCLLPFIQYHSGIISLSHNISGYLKLNDEIIDFSNGKGYIETDWGNTFPQYQIWTQCNSFKTEPNCSVVVSVAPIKLIASSFTGCIGAILYRDKHYRFATHLGAKLTEISPNGFTLLQGEYCFEVMLLHAPTSPATTPLRGDMTRIIHECSKCTIQYRFKINEKNCF